MFETNTLFNLAVSFPTRSNCFRKEVKTYQIGESIGGRNIGEAKWEHPVFSCKILQSMISFVLDEEFIIDNMTYKYSIVTEGLSSKVVLCVNNEYIVFTRGDLFSGAIYHKDTTAIFFTPFMDFGIRYLFSIIKRIFTLHKKNALVNKELILPKHPICEKFGIGIFCGVLLYRMAIDCRDFD